MRSISLMFLLALLLSACGSDETNTDAGVGSDASTSDVGSGNDATVNDTGGTGPTTCVRNSDCTGGFVCYEGTCSRTQPCTQDTDCNVGVCHTTRDFCVECDGMHANECAAGTSCQADFSCG